MGADYAWLRNVALAPTGWSTWLAADDQGLAGKWEYRQVGDWSADDETLRVEAIRGMRNVPLR